MDVQRQDGSFDCGLFAVAFATALANGIEPGKLKFKQDSCTGVGELRMFPAIRQDVQATERSTDFIELFLQLQNA